MSTSQLFCSSVLVASRVLGRVSLLILAMLCSLTFSFAQERSSAQSQLERIGRTFTRIAESNTYVESLDYSDLPIVTLPIGMKRTISGMEVSIAVNRFALSPHHSELGVYAKAVIPQGTYGKHLVLYFGAEGIKGSDTGGLADEIRLSLLQDVEIPFNGRNTKLVLRGSMDTQRGISNSNTYYDCYLRWI